MNSRGGKNYDGGEMSGGQEMDTFRQYVRDVEELGRLVEVWKSRAETRFDAIQELRGFVDFSRPDLEKMARFANALRVSIDDITAWGSAGTVAHGGGMAWAQLAREIAELAEGILSHLALVEESRYESESTPDEFSDIPF